MEERIINEKMVNEKQEKEKEEKEKQKKKNKKNPSVWPGLARRTKTTKLEQEPQRE